VLRKKQDKIFKSNGGVDPDLSRDDLLNAMYTSKKALPFHILCFFILEPYIGVGMRVLGILGVSPPRPFGPFQLTGIVCVTGSFLSEKVRCQSPLFVISFVIASKKGDMK
jgi:hypothetical protein